MRKRTMQFLPRLAVAVVLVVAAASWNPAAAQNCSQPLSEGDTPTIRDCIHIAGASLGVVSCPNCVCDVDGSGAIRITDALRCLRVVVGASTALDCPDCGVTTTTLPPCASCLEGLTGLAEPDELCETSRVVYDDLKQCLCECGECAPLCGTVWIPEDPLPHCSASQVLGCLRVDCQPQVADCLEN